MNQIKQKYQQSIINEVAAAGFDSSADLYDRVRPEYPQRPIDYLLEVLNANSNANILELGAGTGKFTKILMASNLNVTAVEPVAGMREKLKSILPPDSFPRLKVLQGSAESIPVVDKSIDLVIVAQAFHWFDGPLALSEIHRVLRSGGRFGLIWNIRDESVNWISELTKILQPYESGVPRYQSMNWKKAFYKTGLFSELKYRKFDHNQVSTLMEFIDRIESTSFISALSESKKLAVLNLVREYLESLPEIRRGEDNSDSIVVPYLTEVYWTKKLNE
jgi:ubiquinone/menaquinone biosynthesis C-methylase UbiE